MSAMNSNMPKGTRQVALIALGLAACLLAWRGHTRLTETPTAPASPSPEISQLQSLLEPVLGQNAFRLAGHTDEDGNRHLLILADTPQTGEHLSVATTSRIETILTAATGFDPPTDSLRIEHMAFAPGTAGGLQRNDFMELGLLAGICGLLGFLAFAPRRQAGPDRAPVSEPAPEQTPQASRPGQGGTPYLHAVPAEPQHAQPDSHGEAQRIAREHPQDTARILRGWMNEGETG
ncbi:hypothetical protein [Henriciella sp.]|uniref:hypothetical protein n=1 Tax=Henriciella sp. TaxID=1968823 RepID=UPI00261E2364|nr:hypothetical protein [Henriciella sp.]